MTGPSLCVLGVLARVNSRLIREEFAQGAEIFKHSSTEFAEFGEFLIKTLYSASSAPRRCNLRAVLHRKAWIPSIFSTVEWNAVARPFFFDFGHRFACRQTDWRKILGIVAGRVD